MIRIGDSQAGTCEGMTRREWLRVGGLAPLGISLADLLLVGEAQAARPVRIAAPSFGRAKSCIFAFLFGAPAHQDVWDLKPNAPREVRGAFKPIPTSASGIEITEHLPLTAQQAHRYTIVRSVTHPDNTHSIATHYMLTGVRHRKPATDAHNDPTDFPCFGAVAQHQLTSRGPLPASVSLNSPANLRAAGNQIFPGFSGGWLGARADPLVMSQDVSQPGFKPFEVPEMLTPDRLLRRQRLLGEVDRQRSALSELAAVQALRSHQEAALGMVTAPTARRAFDLSLEPSTVRERYGSTAFGQGLLLSRRLIEAGVRMVTINWAREDAFWDTHADNFKNLKDDLLPPFDRAYSALLDDLAARGMLEETLLVCLGEFGRTPAINKKGGRDHWGPCNSIVLAGGGVKSGFVYGKSDRTAAYPEENPVTPEELAATIYHALGIDPHTELLDSQGRPTPLCTADPVMALFA